MGGYLQAEGTLGGCAGSSQQKDGGRRTPSRQHTVGLELTSRPVGESPGGSADEAGLDRKSGSEGP